MRFFLVLMSSLILLFGNWRHRRLLNSWKNNLIDDDNFHKRINYLMVYPILGTLLAFIAVIFY